MANYISKLPEDATLIEGALDYIDPRGNVYGVETRRGNPHIGEYFVKTKQSNYGYWYCGIKYPGGNITKRVHRLVANTFIPNPDNLPIVMHIDNDKKNNNVENLKWGTISENTKQAFDDGLAKNDKSWEDSQSMPVDQYDSATNELIAEFGSVTEAARATNIHVSTIARQCRDKGDKLRKQTYFTFHGDGPREHKVVVAYDRGTDEEVKRFASAALAERYYGISDVSGMIKRGKAKWSKVPVWFKRIKT